MINKFPEYYKKINEPLSIGGQFYKSLGSACNEFLGIKFGGGYSPHIQILAPVFIRIEEAIPLGDFKYLSIF